MDLDFVFVDECVPGIRWDAKYATWDNFTGKPVDGYLANRIVGTMALCAALQAAQRQPHPPASGCFSGTAIALGGRGVFLRWSEGAEDGRKKRRHYPNIDRPELFERVVHPVGPPPGQHRRPALFHLAKGGLRPDGRWP